MDDRRQGTLMARRGGKAVACMLGGIAVVVAAWAATPLVSEELSIRALSSEDQETRTAAIRRLGELRSARAVPYLLEILWREAPGSALRWPGRAEAAAAGEIRTERRERGLGWCGNDVVFVSLSYRVHPATEAVVAIGPAAALIASLDKAAARERDPPTTRTFLLQAIYALGEIGAAHESMGDAIARSLLKMLGNSRSEVAGVAQSALEKLPPARVLLALLDALDRASGKPFERARLRGLIEKIRPLVGESPEVP